MFSTGALAQTRYDMKTAGAPPSVLQRIRRQVGQAISPQRHGRCLTTLLAVHMGAKDPGISIPCDQIAHWLMLMQSGVQVRREAHLADRLSQQPPARRWQAAKAPHSNQK